MLQPPATPLKHAHITHMQPEHANSLDSHVVCVGLCKEIPSQTQVRPNKKRNVETELHLIRDGLTGEGIHSVNLLHGKESEGLDGDLGTFSISAKGWNGKALKLLIGWTKISRMP